jgi:hypothetical protein
MILLYIYCGLCWLFMLFVLRDAWRQVRVSGGLIDKDAWWELKWCLRCFIAAPIMLPICLVLCLVDWASDCRGRKKRRQRRRYREYLFRPVAPGELNRDVGQFFDEHTGPLKDLQFRQIGDYWLWREPPAYIEREFISADGRTFAAISAIDEVRNVEFFSVLTDGSYFETALILYDGHESDTGHQDYDRMHVEWHRDWSIERVFQRHARRLDAASCEAFSYQPEDVRAVSIYASRSSGHRLYNEGKRGELPPPPELPLPQLAPV